MSDRNIYLNIGCGNHPLPGFVNIDRARGADVRRDVTKGIPYPDSGVSGIFSEHFMEHLTQRQGLMFLRECRRVLKAGGILRIAMPDLDDAVNRYCSDDWHGTDDMFKIGYEWVDNRCEMLNLTMREWGHKWVYNEEELTRCARLAGFEVRGRMSRGESDDERFRGLEYRPGSKLIMEFVSRARGAREEHPLVSILIPAYKHRFFRDAVRSALDQTYQNCEIVVCDDSPGTEIQDALSGLGDKDSRIEYFRNRPPEGPSLNYTRCVAVSKGEYIKFLNDDDVLGAGCVSRMAGVLQQRADVTIVACGRERIDENGRTLSGGVSPPRLSDGDAAFEGASLARMLLAAGVNWIGEPTAVMFRREEIEGIRPELMSFGGALIPGFGDLSINLNMLSRGNLAYLGESLCKVREHPGQYQRDPELRKRATDSVYLLRKHAARLGLYRRIWGMPDPLAWLSGYKMRSLEGIGPWRRKLPGPVQTGVFVKKCFEATAWAGRKLSLLRTPRKSPDFGQP